MKNVFCPALMTSPSARRQKVSVKKTVTRSREFSDSIINTVREPLIALDQDLRVVTVSRSFYDFFKVNPEDTVGQLIYDLGGECHDIVDGKMCHHIVDKVL